MEEKDKLTDVIASAMEKANEIEDKQLRLELLKVIGASIASYVEKQKH